MLNIVQVTLSQGLVKVIKEEETSSGGFQSGMKKVRANLIGDVLTLDDALIEIIYHYAHAGEGGYQRRFAAILRELRTQKLAILFEPITT